MAEPTDEQMRETLDELKRAVEECNAANSPYLRAEVKRLFGTRGPLLLQECYDILLWVSQEDESSTETAERDARALRDASLPVWRPTYEN